MVAIEKEIKGRTLVTLSYMFVHWALDKRTSVQARENGAKPELLSFTKTSFILFWTFTVETCKLILLAVVNFIRYGLLNKINFRRATPGTGRPPGGALQRSPCPPRRPVPSRPCPAHDRCVCGRPRSPPIPGLCSPCTSPPLTHSSPRREPQNSWGRQGGRGAAGRRERGVGLVGERSGLLVQRPPQKCPWCWCDVMVPTDPRPGRVREQVFKHRHGHHGTE